MLPEQDILTDRCVKGEPQKDSSDILNQTKREIIDFEDRLSSETGRGQLLGVGRGCRQPEHTDWFEPRTNANSKSPLEGKQFYEGNPSSGGCAKLYHL